MINFRLFRLIGIAALLSFTGQSFAQTTLGGYRHDGPGRVAPSTSTFTVGVSRDNGATFVSTAAVGETVLVRGEIRAEAAHVGQTADIFVVDRLLDSNMNHVGFLMRTSSGAWASWNGTVSLLQPFREDEPLGTVETLDLFTGALATPGEHRIFLGYKPADGTLHYHVNGLPLTITAATYSLSGTLSGSVSQNIVIAMGGASIGTTTTDANGNFIFSGLSAGTYTVMPMHNGQTFTPASLAITITNANSTANAFVSAPSTSDPAVPVVGIFPNSSFVDMPPAQRDPFDGTKVLHRYTLLLPDNCPQEFTIANLGSPDSTLNYQVINEDFANLFVYSNGSARVQGGRSLPVVFSVDPDFVTGPFGGPSPAIGSTQILSIVTPQASNFIKSLVSVDIRSPADLALGTWGGTWSGVGFGGTLPGGAPRTAPVNGNWSLQVDSVDLTTGVIDGSLTWSGIDAVWSNNGLTPSALAVNRVITFTPANTRVEATEWGCGVVTIAFNRNFATSPYSYGPNGVLYLDIPRRLVDRSSIFQSNPVWPNGQTSLSSGNLSGTKISP